MYLQQFIYNVILFAQRVGLDMKDVMDRLYNLEQVTSNPVLYTNQTKPEEQRKAARDNIRTNALFTGTQNPDLIDWPTEYPGLVLKTGDKYIHQDFSNNIRNEYTFMEGNNDLVNPIWKLITFTSTNNNYWEIEGVPHILIKNSANSAPTLEEKDLVKDFFNSEGTLYAYAEYLGTGDGSTSADWKPRGTGIPFI